MQIDNFDIVENNFNASSDDLLEGGIPINDTLKNIKRNNKHILVITGGVIGEGADSVQANYLDVNFNKKFVDGIDVKNLSKKYNLPLVVKQKTKLSDPDYVENINYIKNLLECKVVSNTENIDQLIADSFIVISAISTLAFKPIQLGIPTVVVNGSGQLGNFYDYPGLVNLGDRDIEKNLEYQLNFGKFNEFIKYTIKGGEEFNSTKYYLEEIKKLYENNI